MLIGVPSIVRLRRDAVDGRRRTQGPSWVTAATDVGSEQIRSVRFFARLARRLFVSLSQPLPGVRRKTAQSGLSV